MRRLLFASSVAVVATVGPVSAQETPEAQSDDVTMQSDDLPASEIEGDTFAGVYSLVAGGDAVCAHILDSLNTPRPYNHGYDRWQLSMATEYNFIWQTSSDQGESWSYPVTTGEIAAAVSGFSRLVVDADGDWQPDTFYRTQSMIHGMDYNELAVESRSLPDGGDKPANLAIKWSSASPLSPDSIINGSIADDARHRDRSSLQEFLKPMSDFYRVDLLEVDGRVYAMLADIGGIGRPYVYILRFGEGLSLKAVCTFVPDKNF